MGFPRQGHWSGVAISFSRGISPTQGSNPSLLQWQADSYCWATKEAPAEMLPVPRTIQHALGTPEKYRVAIGLARAQESVQEGKELLGKRNLTWLWIMFCFDFKANSEWNDLLFFTLRIFTLYKDKTMYIPIWYLRSPQVYATGHPNEQKGPRYQESLSCIHLPSIKTSEKVHIY